MITTKIRVVNGPCRQVLDGNVEMAARRLGGVFWAAEGGVALLELAWTDAWLKGGSTAGWCL